MNNIFNITRFWNLLKKDFFTTWKKALGAWLIVFGMFVLCIILSETTHDPRMDVFMLTIVTACIIILFCPFIVESNKDIKKQLFNVILPTSTFEKFLSFIVRNAILIPVVVIGSLYLFHSILEYKYHYQSYYDPNYFNFINLNFLCTIIACQSVFILGYFYFKKYAIFKTTISVIVIVYILLNGISYYYKSINYFDGDIYDYLFAVSYAKEWTGTASTILYICNIVMWLIFPFGLWAISYRRLKETEL